MEITCESTPTTSFSLSSCEQEDKVVTESLNREIENLKGTTSG